MPRHPGSSRHKMQHAFCVGRESSVIVRWQAKLHWRQLWFRSIWALLHAHLGFLLRRTRKTSSMRYSSRLALSKWETCFVSMLWRQSRCAARALCSPRQHGLLDEHLSAKKLIITFYKWDCYLEPSKVRIQIIPCT